jgi:hypothetical protein
MKKKLLILLISISAFTGFSQNNYLDFDGVNDNVDVAGSGNLLAGSSAITMSCKVFPKNLAPSFPGFDGFVGYRNENNFDFYLIQLSSNQVEARFRNSSGVAYTVVYNGLVLNQWNHLFLVYNGSTLKIYSGATQVASVAASGSVPSSNTSTFKIGLIQFQTFNFYHKGFLDEVSLWNKALSVAEITAIINNSGEIAMPDTEVNLKAYYKFNQGTAYGANTGLTTLIDEKGVADGTLSNFALTGPTSNWGNQAALNATSFTKTAFSAFPNPVLNEINFTGSSEIKDIKIIDLGGRTILNQNMDLSQNASLNVSHLNAGIYFATINAEKTIKFIKK